MMNNIDRIAMCAAAIIGVLCLAGTAWAKLPPPTPGQQTQAKEAAAKKAAADAKQKQELTAVEDKIVARYKAKNTPAKAPSASAAAAAPGGGNAAK
jgi:hypothetical protein